MKNKIGLIFKYILIFTVVVSLAVFSKASAQNYSTENNEDVNVESEDALEKAEELLSENSFEKLWHTFTEALRNSFFSFSKKFYLLIFITFMLGIINVMCQQSAATYAGEICLCCFSFSLVATISENVMSLINSLNTFILSLLPVMTSLYTTSVGVATATMSYSSTLVILGACSTMFSSVLLPAVKAIMVFACITLVSRSFDFSGFSKCLKSIVIWLFGVVTCVMSAVVFFQSVISVSKDGLTSRTVRYAAQSLIPIIGGVVSESSRTVAESLKLVRGVTGVSAIFAIIGIIAIPIASILVNKIFIALCASLARLLGASKVSAFYNELCGALNLMLGASIGVSIVFIIILGIFAKVSVQI